MIALPYMPYLRDTGGRQNLKSQKRLRERLVRERKAAAGYRNKIKSRMSNLQPCTPSVSLLNSYVSVVKALTRKANEEFVEVRRADPVNRMGTTATQISQCSVLCIDRPSHFRSCCAALEADIMELRTQLFGRMPVNQDGRYLSLSQKLEDLATLYSRVIDGTLPIDALEKVFLELKQSIAEPIPHSVDGSREHLDPAQRSE